MLRNNFFLENRILPIHLDQEMMVVDNAGDGLAGEDGLGRIGLATDTSRIDDRKSQQGDTSKDPQDGSKTVWLGLR